MPEHGCVCPTEYARKAVNGLRDRHGLLVPSSLCKLRVPTRCNSKPPWCDTCQRTRAEKCVPRSSRSAPLTRDAGSRCRRAPYRSRVCLALSGRGGVCFGKKGCQEVCYVHFQGLNVFCLGAHERAIKGLVCWPPDKGPKKSPRDVTETVSTHSGC